MKLSKLYPIIGLLTALAVIYIHMHMQVIDLAYLGKAKEQAIHDRVASQGIPIPGRLREIRLSAPPRRLHGLPTGLSGQIPNDFPTEAFSRNWISLVVGQVGIFARTRERVMLHMTSGIARLI